MNARTVTTTPHVQIRRLPQIRKVTDLPALALTFSRASSRCWEGADMMAVNCKTTCRVALTVRVRRTGRRRSSSCRSIFHRLGVTVNRHCPGRRRAPSRWLRLHATSPAARLPPMCVAACASLTAWGCPSSARAAASSTTALIWTSACSRISAEGGPGRRLYGP
jgi:hypothetical protein